MEEVDLEPEELGRQCLEMQGLSHLLGKGSRAGHFSLNSEEGAGPPHSSTISGNAELAAFLIPASPTHLTPGIIKAGYVAMPCCLVAFLIVLSPLTRASVCPWWFGLYPQWERGASC